MKCLKIYENQGRFQMAGKIVKQLGEDSESAFDYKQAIFFFKKGADYFAMENSNSKSYEQGCLLKLADLLCLTDDPEAAKEAKIVKF
jgi:Soluble NSF attachment protein, SNAP